MTRRVIGISASIWLLLSVSLWASGWEPDILVLGGIIVTGGVMLVVGARLAIRVRPVSWPTADGPDELATVDHQRVQILLGDIDGSGRADTSRVRERLLQLMDQRLLTEHGIDRTAHPQAAAELLTPPLLRLVDEPAPLLRDARELRSILTDLEGL